MDPVAAARAARRIREERAETVRTVDALAVELDRIIESVAQSNTDDEHDPDGATSGYERAKAAALLEGARARLVELDRAADRLRAGSYGRCEGCGAEIDPARLDALVAAARCVGCAARSATR